MTKLAAIKQTGVFASKGYGEGRLSASMGKYLGDYLG